MMRETCAPSNGGIMPSHLARVGSVAAIAGALLLMISTYLHPLDADPNDAEAAFAEYAADSLWVASHLGQCVAIAMLSVALLALATAMDSGRAAAWVVFGVLGVSASVAAAAALQAVDGVALKLVVGRWAQTSGEARAGVRGGIRRASGGNRIRQSAQPDLWSDRVGVRRRAGSKSTLWTCDRPPESATRIV